ncbi:unnamed protein product, partial [Allacma fusca]
EGVLCYRYCVRELRTSAFRKNMSVTMSTWIAAMIGMRQIVLVGQT